MAQGKVNLYGLGTAGVNVVKSPLHLEDNELTKAQNAMPDRLSGLGSIRKREGLVAFTTGAMAGAVRGIAAVPLALPSIRTLHVGAITTPQFFYDIALPGFSGTNNNTVMPRAQVWSSTAGSFSGGFQSQDGNFALIQPAATLNGIFYYPLQSPRGVLVAYDGRRSYEVCRFPNCAAVGPIFLYNGLLYVGVMGSGVDNFIYQVDPGTGQMEIIGSSTTFSAASEILASGCDFLGKIWIGVSEASQGRLYSIRPDESSWTLERSAAAGVNTYTSVAMYKGNLYAATAAAAGTAAIIEQRTPAGVWSTTRTGGASAELNYFDGLQVFDGNLYAIYSSASQFAGGTGDSSFTCELHKFDGSSWSVDRDLGASDSIVVPLGKAVTADTLFYATWRDPGGASPYQSGRILKRTTGGVFSTVALGAGGAQPQNFGFTGELGT